MSQPCVSVSAFDCDILRSAFMKLVTEENIPEDQWRSIAVWIRDYTDGDGIDPGLLEWLVRK